MNSHYNIICVPINRIQTNRVSIYSLELQRYRLQWWERQVCTKHRRVTQAQHRTNRYRVRCRHVNTTASSAMRNRHRSTHESKRAFLQPVQNRVAELPAFVPSTKDVYYADLCCVHGCGGVGVWCVCILLWSSSSSCDNACLFLSIQLFQVSCMYDISMDV